MKLGFYFLRIVDRATDERQKNDPLFRLLFWSLDKLSKLTDALEIGAVRRYFEVNFLRVEGLFRNNADTDILISDHIGERGCHRVR